MVPERPENYDFHVNFLAKLELRTAPEAYLTVSSLLSRINGDCACP